MTLVLPITSAAIVEQFGHISFNQTALNFVTGQNGSNVPVATVFRVNASDLASANQISINLLPGSNVNTSLVVINVEGASQGRFNLSNVLIQLNGLPPANLVWNTCDATSIGITNTQFPGSLLAPFSALSLG